MAGGERTFGHAENPLAVRKWLLDRRNWASEGKGRRRAGAEGRTCTLVPLWALLGTSDPPLSSDLTPHTHTHTHTYLTTGLTSTADPQGKGEEDQQRQQPTPEPYGVAADEGGRSRGLGRGSLVGRNRCTAHTHTSTEGWQCFSGGCNPTQRTLHQGSSLSEQGVSQPIRGVCRPATPCAAL